MQSYTISILNVFKIGIPLPPSLNKFCNFHKTNTCLPLMLATVVVPPGNLIIPATFRPKGFFKASKQQKFTAVLKKV